MKIFLVLIFLCLGSTGCIEKKIRDLESPCAAAVGVDISAKDPCIKRPVNIGII